MMIMKVEVRQMKKNQINVRIQDSLKQVLSERAALEGRTLSDLVCLLLSIEMNLWRQNQDCE